MRNIRNGKRFNFAKPPEICEFSMQEKGILLFIIKQFERVAQICIPDKFRAIPKFKID